MTKMEPIGYHQYLKIDQLLACQKMRSSEFGHEAHDEHLFIIVHQTYELWFKQILREFESIRTIMGRAKIDENEMGLIVSRLERVHEIQKLIAQQIDIMETMTPMDFLEFRDLLYPASGFQSFQFRLVENMLGLDSSVRMVYNNVSYKNHFDEEQRKQLEISEQQTSILEAVQSWLERTPFLKSKEFDFWSEYRKAVVKMFNEDKDVIRNNPLLGDEQIKINLEQVEQSENVFESLFDEKQFEKLRKDGYWRLGHKAVLSALFIHLYRDMPVLHLPYRLLTKLKDIDETLTHWRYRHALMAKRMLGTKIGTGGSSGAQYLRESTEKHKIFTDFFQLSTFFIPRSQLPKLPEELKRTLDFHYTKTN